MDDRTSSIYHPWWGIPDRLDLDPPEPTNDIYADEYYDEENYDVI